MAILTIRKYPDQVLRTKATPLTRLDQKLKAIIADMKETMYLFKGVGLAAPQVGISDRLIIFDIGNGPMILINPEIIRREGQTTLEEGCLSIPELRTDIERSEMITVKGKDIDGKEIQFDADGLMARVIQHEIDHLEGHLIIDELSRIERELFLGRLKKAEKEKKIK